jgi:hypothetical protein
MASGQVFSQGTSLGNCEELTDNMNDESGR